MLWLVICIAKKFIWTTLKLIFSTKIFFFAPSDFRYSNRSLYIGQILFYPNKPYINGKHIHIRWCINLNVEDLWLVLWSRVTYGITVYVATVCIFICSFIKTKTKMCMFTCLIWYWLISTWWVLGWIYICTLQICPKLYYMYINTEWARYTCRHKKLFQFLIGFIFRLNTAIYFKLYIYKWHLCMNHRHGLMCCCISCCDSSLVRLKIYIVMLELSVCQFTSFGEIIMNH